MGILTALSDSDAAWVRRALEDRQKAFEVLVLRYQKKAHAIARAIGVPDAAVEDVVQEAFLKAFENLPHLRDAGCFGLWFLNIVRNGARRWLRAARSRPTVPLPEGLAAGDDASREQEELRQVLWSKLAEMPEAVREAVFLYYHEGRSIREVAKALAISRSAALKRLERGRDLLREKLWRDLEADIESSLPSEDAWRRKGRQLAFLLLGAVATSWGLRASVAAAAAASGALGAGAFARSEMLGKLALGGIGMVTKKTSIAALAAVALCLGISGYFFFSRGSGDRSEEAPAGQAARSGAPPRARAASTGEVNPPAEAQVAAKVKPAGPDAPSGLLVSIHGKVAARDGQVIEKASVIALPARRWTTGLLGADPGQGPSSFSDPAALRAIVQSSVAEGEKLPRAVSGPDGTYRFYGLEAGEYRLLASHPDFLPSADGWATVGDAPGRCDMVLAEGDSIAGRVVDERGQPVANAAVSARPSEDRRLGLRGRKSRFLEEVLGGTFLVARRESASDADGSFRLPSLEIGLHDVRARKPGFAAGIVLDVPAGKSDLSVVLPAGFSIRGRLLYADRKPAAGIAVTLAERSTGKATPPAVGQAMDQEYAGQTDPAVEESVASCVTGPGGQFELGGLRPGGYDLAARAKELAPLSLDVRIEDATVDLGEIVLAAARSVRGRVIDFARNPVADARVWIESSRTGGVANWGGRYTLPEALAETRSSAKGDFSLDGLPEGVFTLRASSRDWTPVALPSIASGSTGVDVLLGKGAAVNGIVVDAGDGSPIAGADVILVMGLTPLPVPDKRAETGEQGTFEIRGVPSSSDRRGLRVRHPAYGTPRDFPLADNLKGDPIKITLSVPDQIRGRVTDADGNGISGAFVRLGIGAEWLAKELGSAVSGTVSASDGSFSVDVPPAARGWGEVTLSARHSTLGSASSPPVKPPGGDSAWPEVEIAFTATSELRGRVTDPAGAPVARSSLRATRTIDARPQGEPVTAVSDARGAYRLTGLQQGVYQVEVRAPEFAPRKTDGIEVGPETREQDFALEPGFGIQGKVVDENGRGVPGAEVIAMEPDSLDDEKGGWVFGQRRARRTEAGGVASTLADGSGAYELAHLEEKELTIVARAPGYEPSELVRVRPGQSPDPLVLARLSAVSGTVVEADTGRPVPLFTLYTMSAGGESVQVIPRDYDDPAGNFLIDGMAPGKWTVLVVSRGYVTWSGDVSLAAGQLMTVEAKLDRGSVLRGAAVDADSGAPLAGVAVSAIGGPQRKHPIPADQQWTDENGSFAIGGLAPGKYELHISHPAYFHSGTLRAVIGDSDPEPIRVELRPGGRLEGKIENYRLEGIMWSRLVLTKVEEERREGAPARATEKQHAYIDFNGKLSSGTIPPGTYNVKLLDEFRKAETLKKRQDLIPREDIEDRHTELGQIEIRAGETTVFNWKRP